MKNGRGEIENSISTKMRRNPIKLIQNSEKKTYGGEILQTYNLDHASPNLTLCAFTCCFVRRQGHFRLFAS